MTELKNYAKYKQYEVVTSYFNSEKLHYLFKFDNGYGASVVKGYGSYGYEDDLFELAVIYWDTNDRYRLIYDTEITNDVVGYLSNDKVLLLLDEIMKLR